MSNRSEIKSVCKMIEKDCINKNAVPAIIISCGEHDTHVVYASGFERSDVIDMLETAQQQIINNHIPLEGGEQ